MLDCVTCGMGPEALTHQTIAECEATMRRTEGRGCANPRDHHTYEAEAAPMTDEAYNGWKNRATWAVNLWIMNDEPTYRDAVALDLDVPEAVAESRARDFVEALLFGDEAPANLATDLLNGVLPTVDWGSIVESIRESQS